MTTPNMNLALWLPQAAPSIGEVVTVATTTPPYQTQFAAPAAGGGGGGSGGGAPPVVVGTTAPAVPFLGQVWVDTSSPTPAPMVWNGTTWVSVSAPAASDDLARDGSETMQGALDMDEYALLNVDINAGTF